MKRTESFQATVADLKLINRYTRKEYAADELYTFSMIAADTRIDRDFECFDADTLKEMSERYVGTTVICDHTPSANNQLARIFKGRVEPCADGVQQLVLSAYMPKEGNDDMIAKIDSGIVKEVSVGCSVQKCTCSICGRTDGNCSHIKGKSYSGQQCYRILSGLADVYEVSFVAVPAQRAAGVIKCFKSFGDVPAPTEEPQPDTADIRLRLAAAEIYLREIDNNGNE